MKAIFSFKSKPFTESYGKRMGGFYNDHYFKVSFRLALHCARKSFERVELYTDAIGYNLLINTYQLVFDKVHIVLDDLKDIPTDIWMAGKLYAYSLQTEPYVHLDYDLFLLKPISEEFLKMPIIVQCEEPFNGGDAYQWGIDWIQDSNRNIPIEFNFSKAIPYQEQKAYNMGLVGGQAYTAMADYGKKALQLIRNNIDAITELPSSVQNAANIIYEQYFFTQYMGYHNIPVTSYMPESLSCLDFDNSTFIHVLSILKNNLEVCEKIETLYLSQISKH